MLNIKALLSKRPVSTTIKVSLAITVTAFSFVLIKSFKTSAQTPVSKQVTTRVTIGNDAPSFTSGPAEATASTADNPTAAGGTVTFNATATDSNGQSYYLIVCSVAGIDASTRNCTGTGAVQYCNTTTATASGTATSCSYTATTTSFVNPWFAYVCDADPTAPACSGAAQGTGDSGSPFYVNHAPTFTAITNTSPANPGGSITWNATASDSDGNTVKLLVCKTANMANGVCTDGAWCESSATASNPSCTYNVPTVAADGSNNAYVFVVDQYNIAATGTAQGSTSNFTINNVAPVVSNVTLNNGSAITLTAKATTSVPLTANVVDLNGCSATEIPTVQGYIYRTDATCDSSANNDYNYCYAQILCTQDAGSCNASAGTATYTCTANIQYYADPTLANTVHAGKSWTGKVTATDNNSASHSATSTGVQMNTLLSFDITNEINYGSLRVGQIDNETNLPQELVTTPTGNVGLNQSHEGTQMCTDYPTCAGATISVGSQRYGTTSTTRYDDGMALTGSPVLVSLQIPKVTDHTQPITTGTTWWGIQIPTGTTAGTYTGQNTIVSSMSPSANW